MKSLIITLSVNLWISFALAGGGDVGSQNLSPQAVEQLTQTMKQAAENSSMGCENTVHLSNGSTEIGMRLRSKNTSDANSCAEAKAREKQLHNLIDETGDTADLSYMDSFCKASYESNQRDIGRVVELSVHFVTTMERKKDEKGQVTFLFTGEIGDHSIIKATAVASADENSLISFKKETFNERKVNVGTEANPIWQNRFKLSETLNCK